MYGTKSFLSKHSLFRQFSLIKPNAKKRHFFYLANKIAWVKSGMSLEVGNVLLWSLINKNNWINKIKKLSLSVFLYCFTMFVSPQVPPNKVKVITFCCPRNKDPIWGSFFEHLLNLNYKNTDSNEENPTGQVTTISWPFSSNKMSVRDIFDRQTLIKIFENKVT